jgi:hypothetical protein
MQEQAKAAVLDGKWEQLRFLGNRFERAGCYAEAWNALAEKVEKTSTQTLPIWPGPKAISNGVLVLPRSRDLGDELRILRYLGNLQAHTQRVTALVDPRLAPLLERNFPGLVCTDPAQPPPLDGITHMAAQERLALWFGANAEQIKSDFRPLISKKEPQQKCRGIGISWFSRSKNKSFPSIEDWSVLLKNVRHPSVPSNTWRSLLGFANSKNSANNGFRARDPSISSTISMVLLSKSVRFVGC